MEKQTNKVLTKLPQEVEIIVQTLSMEKKRDVKMVLDRIFVGVAKMEQQLENIVVADENDNINMQLAKTIRLGIRRIRLDADPIFEAKRKEVQALMLSYKTEDSLWLKVQQVKDILTKDIEAKAKFKEETKERFDAYQHLLKTQGRNDQVSKFSTEILQFEYEHMSDHMFGLFIKTVEKQYNDAVEAANLALEVERKATEERVTKEKEDAKVKLALEAENKKLKDDLEAVEKARKEADLTIITELNAKKVAASIALKAPRKEKLDNWVNSFSISSIPDGIGSDATAIEIVEKFEAFKKWAKTKIK